jgi:hypothetical protein
VRAKIKADSVQFSAAGGFLSRNLYILAATLGLFGVLAMGMAILPHALQPGLPANAALWRSVGLLLLLGGLISALVGVMTNLFEQVDRRSEAARINARISARQTRRAERKLGGIDGR